MCVQAELHQANAECRCACAYACAPLRCVHASACVRQCACPWACIHLHIRVQLLLSHAHIRPSPLASSSPGDQPSPTATTPHADEESTSARLQQQLLELQARLLQAEAECSRLHDRRSERPAGMHSAGQHVSHSLVCVIFSAAPVGLSSPSATAALESTSLQLEQLQARMLQSEAECNRLRESCEQRSDVV